MQPSHGLLKFVIIGFGAAGANAADTLRRLDPDAEITVLNGEGGPFYLRLDLEGVFQGKPLEQLIPRPPEYWRDRGIAVLPQYATAIDVEDRIVITQDGERLPFDKLLIACGSRPRELAVAGDGYLEGIHHYHTLQDALAILAHRNGPRKMLVVGGGILGLEVAKAGHDFGWEVTVLIRGAYPGSPIVDLSSSHLISRSLDRAGVKQILNDQVLTFVNDGAKVTGAITRGNRVISCDLTVICVGVEPDVRWLADTGLLDEHGQLIVNERMESCLPHIYGAGDAVHVRSDDGHLIPCHTWNVATSQARVAAANMCGGNQLWRGDLLYNLDHLFDQEFAMIGEWERRHETGFELHEFFLESEYRGLVVHEGLLVGALLLGNRRADRRVRKLISQKARVTGKLERIFEPNAKPEDFR